MSSGKGIRHGFQCKVLLDSNKILIPVAYFGWRGAVFLCQQQHSLLDMSSVLSCILVLHTIFYKPELKEIKCG